VITEKTDITESNSTGGILLQTVIGGWLPLIAMPAAVIAFRHRFEDWVFMWVLAFSIFWGFKWLTWRRCCNSPVSRLRSLAYLLLWPGMDAKDFLYKPGRPAALREWLRVSAKVVAGAWLLWWASAQVAAAPLLAGWAGMAGAVLFLHFGVFSLIALAYRAAGISAKPLMCSPLRATSLSDFWGRRWNTAFNKLAHDLVLVPLSRRIGAFWSTLSVFVASGLVHDLVISIPARGGYGQPTAYFVLQGAAVLFERSRAGELLGLGEGCRGWTFLLAVTCVPLPWLFHATFVHHIILPMLGAIGGFRRAL
jgi:alginate O-acetyltransferase complex protein AlgI